MADFKFLETFTSKFLSLFSRREVKTPLSFFFRVVLALTLVAIVALFLCEPGLRFTVFLVLVGMLLLLSIGVYVFAWLKPKHLVYGETGHRAEWRMGLGTDKREIGEAEMATLPASTNTVITSEGPVILPGKAGES